MKKLIAILTIAIVLVGAVFAETHTVTVKTHVPLVEPVFKLTASAKPGEQGTAVNATDTNGTADWSATANYNTTIDGTETLDISTKDIIGTFTAVLANKAKDGNPYTLTFTAGPINAKAYGTGDKARTRVDYKVEPEHTSETNYLTNAIGTTGGAATGIVSDGVQTKAWDATNLQLSQAIKIHFNGTECTEGKIAVFTVTWGADSAVLPNTTDSETYDATVTLTISAN